MTTFETNIFANSKTILSSRLVYEKHEIHLAITKSLS